MKSLRLGRCWMALMVATTGVTPIFFDVGCLQTHDERQTFLEGTLSDPWAATPGSTAIPGSYMGGLVSTAINDTNNDGLADATDLQRVLNWGFASLATWIQSQIDVNNPYGWADQGLPR